MTYAERRVEMRTAVAASKAATKAQVPVVEGYWRAPAPTPVREPRAHTPRKRKYTPHPRPIKPKPVVYQDTPYVPWYKQDGSVPQPLLDAARLAIKNIGAVLQFEDREDIVQEVALWLLIRPEVDPINVIDLFRRLALLHSNRTRSMETIYKTNDPNDEPWSESIPDDFNLEEHVFAKLLFGHQANDLGEQQ